MPDRNVEEKIQEIVEIYDRLAREENIHDPAMARTHGDIHSFAAMLRLCMEQRNNELYGRVGYGEQANAIARLKYNDALLAAAEAAR